MEKSNPIISLVDADLDGIGNKARRLAMLMQHNPTLFSVPSGLVLLPHFDIKKHAKDLSAALEPFGEGLYAVRSCGLDEDGALESMAGKFHTELFVPTQTIIDAISKVRQSYGSSLETSAVLVQQMVEPDYAGVLFTRSPENHGLASCEYSEGTADAVVSGQVEPTRIDYGRWTGNIYPPQKERKDMLSLLFLVGLIIETRMGEPQDIEWAYIKKSETLYILQSRDITSQLYDTHIAEEQEKWAKIASGGKNGQKGLTVFKNAAVREVVISPTLLTRSFVERIYSPSGSLGKSLDLLGLPYPTVTVPYVSSIFGKLYENTEVEKQLFGVRPKLLWANRKIKKKLDKNPAFYLDWLKERIENFPGYPVDLQGEATSVQDCAKGVIEGVRVFLNDVYPIAYAATLLAQFAREESDDASLTSQMMRDLSRLHHTGNMQNFTQKWGLRSANDYELSEPRFCESPEAALLYAEKFSDFPWEDIEYGNGFTHLKEVAKDRAIQWLYSLRLHIVTLEHNLNLEAGLIYFLNIDNINALAEQQLQPEDIPALCAENQLAEDKWSTISLGDDLSLETIELLKKSNEKQTGLHGKMVSARVTFKGRAQHINTLGHLDSKENVILISEHLTPELVGLFPGTVGCLVDMGGALSHAAIVARELDYPILVLAGSSSTICDGDLVEVGPTGSITITR